MEVGVVRDRSCRRLAAVVLGLALLLAGCGSDDGAGVRNVDGTQAASGSGTASPTTPSARRSAIAPPGSSGNP